MVVGIFKTTVSEACTGFQVWMGSAQVDQRGPLHCFNSATVFEHMEEGLNLLAAAIPVAQLDNGFTAFCRQVKSANAILAACSHRSSDLALSFLLGGVSLYMLT